MYMRYISTNKGALISKGRYFEVFLILLLHRTWKWRDKIFSIFAVEFGTSNLDLRSN